MGRVAMQLAKNGFVYLIAAEGQGLFKIGYTVGSPLQRLKGLQTGSPHPLRVAGVIPTMAPHVVEQRLHQEFALFRQSGEWFALSQEIVQALLQREQALLDPALESKDFVVIENRYLALRCDYVNKNDLVSLTTERCLFCSERHFHGSGNRSASLRENILTFGHRHAHCLKVLSSEVILLSGAIVYQKDGYFLQFVDGLRRR